MDIDYYTRLIKRRKENAEENNNTKEEKGKCCVRVQEKGKVNKQ